MFVCPECGSAQPAQGHCGADGTPLAPIGEDVLLGTTIGAYRVARLLGIGGMGRVYKGVHPTIGSRVAIKVLSRECSDRRDLVERFFAEAKAVNLIRHESIVNVLDLATLPDGRPFIIMEYLDGAPLAALIEHAVRHQAPMPLGGMARLAAEVLDALGAAHAKGIVHRDLKRDNIFVAPSGRPKVLDFGIAKLSDVNNASTRTGSLLGTPHYMSAEQAAGRPVDHRADLYAIGVILFECATGRKPFLAEALFDLLRMHVEAPPPSPRALRPDMPPDLEHVILTALAKSPDQRFSTAMAMSMALQHATAQLPPEQWRPLAAPSAHTPSGISWAPTPPVSWSGPGSRPPPPPPGHVSTVSAGQVTRPARKPSKKGLWIGVVLTVLLGGGITAAIVTGGGHGTTTAADKGSEAVADKGAGGAGAGDKPADKGAPADKPADKGDPWATPGKEAPTAPTPAPAGSADEADDDDEPPSEAPAPRPGKHAADPVGDALKDMEEQIKRLPPEQQKRLAAYKGISKLPPAERMKRLRELSQQGITAMQASDPLAEMEQQQQQQQQQQQAPAGAWVTNHDIDPPPGYDPEHLDVTAFIPWAIAQARKAIPDAQLIRIDSNGVSADGRANLKLPSFASDHGSIDLRFISPSRGKRDPSQPLGVARRDFKCEFRVMATPEGVEMLPINFVDCAKERVVPVPKCSFAGVWKKAIARKAPSQNAVGNVDYRSNGSRPVWYFAIGSGTDTVFSEMFGDDC
ncbi:MAG TPA: serine/threonine-protein kinase [Kofleriaceae bacterium]|nr:serine/threonine-protein kinase [Kofleriaceae bacterium]